MGGSHVIDNLIGPADFPIGSDIEFAPLTLFSHTRDISRDIITLQPPQ